MIVVQSCMLCFTGVLSGSLKLREVQADMRHEPKTVIARRVQRLLPFDAPNLRLLSIKELRHLERFISEAMDQEPDCGLIEAESAVSGD